MIHSQFQAFKTLLWDMMNLTTIQVYHLCLQDWLIKFEEKVIVTRNRFNQVLEVSQFRKKNSNSWIETSKDSFQIGWRDKFWSMRMKKKSKVRTSIKTIMSLKFLMLMIKVLIENLNKISMNMRKRKKKKKWHQI